MGPGLIISSLVAVVSDWSGRLVLRSSLTGDICAIRSDCVICV